MRRMFASLCLMASLVFLSSGCGGDPEVAKNEPVIVEFIKVNNQTLVLLDEMTKDPVKTAKKMAEHEAKVKAALEKWEKVPANVKEKLVAKHKAEWDKMEKAMKGSK